MSPRFEKLSNGLGVVLVPCEAESVAVGVFVNSGSRHETAKTAGISHFIEHMLFKGTPTRSPLDITLAIEGRGGNFNACTGEESTNYFTHMPSEYLAESLDILSDMYLRATIPDEEFEREKQVVLEEIKMYADEPDSVAMENLQASLFPKSRLGAPVAGSAKSLTPLKPADLRAYIRRHYRPDNTIVVVVGDFKPEVALKAVENSFGKFRRAKPRPSSIGESFGAVVPSVRVEKEVNQCQLAIGYRTFGICDERKYAATVLDAILGRGMSSRLFQEVREKRGLSYDIASRMQFFRDAGMLTVTAGLTPAKVERAVKTITREIERLATKRVSADELRRTQEFLIGNFRLSFERVTTKMFFFGQTTQSFGRLVLPSEQIEGIRQVTAADVLAVAQEIFNDKRCSLSLVTPK